MAVYPFYTEVSSTTRSSSVGVGCRAKNGSMTTKIYQRENGEITTPYEVKQFTAENTETGKISLTTRIYFQGMCIHEHTTDYWYTLIHSSIGGLTLHTTMWCVRVSP